MITAGKSTFLEPSKKAASQETALNKLKFKTKSDYVYQIVDYFRRVDVGIYDQVLVAVLHEDCGVDVGRCSFID